MSLRVGTRFLSCRALRWFRHGRNRAFVSGYRVSLHYYRGGTEVYAHFYYYLISFCVFYARKLYSRGRSACKIVRLPRSLPERSFHSVVDALRFEFVQYYITCRKDRVTVGSESVVVIRCARRCESIVATRHVWSLEKILKESVEKENSLCSNNGVYS